MIQQTYTLELITPCFCGGADPQRQAEIRPASIRGQLRWWFRVLGGFKSLGSQAVQDQEAMIFGSMAGDEGNAGKLIIRVSTESMRSVRRDGQELGHPNSSDPAYLTFPVQTRERHGVKEGYDGRGVILNGSFDLHVVWRGPAALKDDIAALVAIFGQIGALGFRSRRAMGALHLRKPPLSLMLAQTRFSTPSAVEVFAMSATSSRDAVAKLAKWLRGWRQHGRSAAHTPAPPPASPPTPGFDFALRDHDEGLAGLGRARPTTRPSGRTPLGGNGDSFMPALGLPIIQFYSSIGGPRRSATLDWNAATNGGRFASPILLRPHYDGSQWRALVIFLDNRQWDYTQSAHVSSGTPRGTRRVLPDLYDAMKRDAVANIPRFT